MKHITAADVEFARKMHIALEPELTLPEMRLIAARAKLDTANETIEGLQKAYDFMRSQRDMWRRRLQIAVVASTLGFIIREVLR